MIYTPGPVAGISAIFVKAEKTRISSPRAEILRFCIFRPPGDRRRSIVYVRAPQGAPERVSGGRSHRPWKESRMLRVDAGACPHESSGLSRRSFVQLGMAGLASLGLPGLMRLKEASANG